MSDGHFLLTAGITAGSAAAETMPLKMAPSHLATPAGHRRAHRGRSRQRQRQLSRPGLQRQRRRRRPRHPQSSQRPRRHPEWRRCRGRSQAQGGIYAGAGAAPESQQCVWCYVLADAGAQGGACAGAQAEPRLMRLRLWRRPTKVWAAAADALLRQAPAPATPPARCRPPLTTHARCRTLLCIARVYIKSKAPAMLTPHR